ncbi:MAG: hypothetical protein V3R57_06875 [Candidatus Bathyarchaeia archaeon]
MKQKSKKRGQASKKLSKGAEQVLQEAKIVARWAKKPFYIS